MGIEVPCVPLCVLKSNFRRLILIMKKMITLIISCAMLSAIFISGCAEESTVNSGSVGNDTSQTTSSITAEEDETGASGADIVEKDANESTDSNIVDSTPTESPQNDDGEIIVDDEAHDTYEFVDETVTNPTVATYEIENPDTEVDSEVTAESLKGLWEPLVVTSVADGKELNFNLAFGSAYSQYGGSLEILDDGNFTLSMGAAVKEANSKGTFTLSGNNLLVTYSDESTDTFLYIPKYQNHQVIKTQIGSFYVYFYKK